MPKQITQKANEANEEKPMPQDKAPRTPFLTGTQELFADIIGELIISGGTRRNLNALCRIAADHKSRRFYNRFSIKDLDQIDKGITADVERWAAIWYDELAAARASGPKLPAAIRPEPKNVSDLVRAQKRKEVESYFKDFLAGAAPEEIQFMWQLMADWASIHSHWSSGYEEMYLANAFELQLGRDREYVRVPPHLTDDVTEYIRALLKVQPEETETVH